MSRIEYDGDEQVRLVYDNERECFGFTAPNTNGELAVFQRPDGYSCYIVAINSGIEVDVWDETPEALNSSWWPKGTLPSESRFGTQYIFSAFALAEETYAAGVAAGVPFRTPDAAELQAALNKGSFIVRDDEQPVLWVRERISFTPRRKTTQKLLDGGEDMTV